MYHKIVLKLSGESLAGENNFGIDFNKALEIASSLKKIYDENLIDKDKYYYLKDTLLPQKLWLQNYRLPKPYLQHFS